MSEDWDTVTVLRKRAPPASTTKSQAFVNAARQSGAQVVTEKKYASATNKHPVTDKDTAKLDRETEQLQHALVDASVSRVISQARVAKGWKQKDLATHIAEREQIVQQYEAGTAIPNSFILGKMERVLGVKLRGKKETIGCLLV